MKPPCPPPYAPSQSPAALQLQIPSHDGLGRAFRGHVEHEHAGAPHVPQRLLALSLIHI